MVTHLWSRDADGQSCVFVNSMNEFGDSGICAEIKLATLLDSSDTNKHLLNSSVTTMHRLNSSATPADLLNSRPLLLVCLLNSSAWRAARWDTTGTTAPTNASRPRCKTTSICNLDPPEGSELVRTGALHAQCSGKGTDWRACACFPLAWKQRLGMPLTCCKRLCYRMAKAAGLH